MSTDQARTLPFDEADAARKIERWWSLIGQEPAYPVDTTTVVQLLTAVEYRVTPDDLTAFMSQNVIPKPARVDGRMAWGPCHILAAGFALEHRRRWIPLTTLHRHKLTLGEWSRMSLEATGEALFVDLHDHDLDELLGLLIKVAGDVSAVGLVAEAIRAKFAQMEHEGLSDD